MTNEEKTISILKKNGQTKPDYGRFVSFISQMNVAMDTGRNLQIKYERIPSFWTLGRLLTGTALIFVITFIAYLSPVNDRNVVKLIDQTILAYQDNALYEELYISYNDASLIVALDDQELELFNQINYEIENI